MAALWSSLVASFSGVSLIKGDRLGGWVGGGGLGSFWRSGDYRTRDHVATLWGSLAASFSGVSLIKGGRLGGGGWRRASGGLTIVELATMWPHNGAH